tara:strand:+ start:917 stop:1531 length:615 start_codon:yes stop_codon:yes gene_type:complete
MVSPTEENTVDTIQGADIEYAGFWIRVLASVLDSIFLLMIIVPLLLVFYGPGILFAMESPGLVYDFINYGLPLIVIVVFWQYRSATPGKIMMDIYIVDEKTLQHPPFGRLVLRYLGYYVSIIPLFLGLIWVGIDKRKQGFHDKIAKTLVIRNKPKSASELAMEGIHQETNEKVIKGEDERKKNDENLSESAAEIPIKKHDPWKE